MLSILVVLVKGPLEEAGQQRIVFFVTMMVLGIYFMETLLVVDN